jgi:hypothetical protein
LFQPSPTARLSVCLGTQLTDSAVLRIRISLQHIGDVLIRNFFTEVTVRLLNPLRIGAVVPRQTQNAIPARLWIGDPEKPFPNALLERTAHDDSPSAHVVLREQDLVEDNITVRCWSQRFHSSATGVGRLRTGVRSSITLSGGAHEQNA